MGRIIIRLIDAPVEFRGCVREDADGNYNVYINARLSEAEQQRALLHELRHIFFGHLDDDVKSIEEKEREADYGRVQTVRPAVDLDRQVRAL